MFAFHKPQLEMITILHNIDKTAHKDSKIFPAELRRSINTRTQPQKTDSSHQLDAGHRQGRPHLRHQAYGRGGVLPQRVVEWRVYQETTPAVSSCWRDGISGSSRL